MAAAAAPAIENLQLGDGSTMELARIPNVDDETWQQVKDYLVSNPDAAKAIQSFGKNPDAMRGWFQTQAMAEHYQKKMTEEGHSGVTAERMKALEHDPELAPIFEDIKKNGLEAMMKHCKDEELMLKFSRKIGGLPQELVPKLKSLDEVPMNLHEAARMGDLRAVQQFVDKKKTSGCARPQRYHGTRLRNRCQPHRCSQVAA